MKQIRFMLLRVEFDRMSVLLNESCDSLFLIPDNRTDYDLTIH